MSLILPQLSPDPEAPFPPLDAALLEPDGLLAFGGDLSPTRLLNAYRHGIFPWYSNGEPILWWSPSERALFRTDAIHLSTRFRRTLRRSRWIVRADTAFDDVIAACANTPRSGQPGTWITEAMQRGYRELHRLGHAHSIEVFDGTHLVGGAYGISVGRLFCGESMFSAASGASSAALAALGQFLHGRGWPLIDAQIPNDHTRRLGVETWSRSAYLRALEDLRDADESAGTWTAAFGGCAASGLANPTAA